MRRSLTILGTSATLLIRGRTAQSKEHQNYPVVGKNYLTPIVARMEIF